MTLYDFTNIGIVVFGIFATLFSASLGWKFWKLDASLAKPFALSCFAGAAAGAATLAFSVASVFGAYGHLHPLLVDLLRLVIFGGLTGSDFYMWKKVTEIGDG